MNWKRLSRVFLAFGSGSSLLIFAAGWVIYYVTVFVWSKEALGRFVTELNDNITFQIIAVLFLFSLLTYIIRTASNIARTHTWMLPLWLIFPLGIWLFLAGFFLNAAIIHEGKIVIGEGDPVQPPWDTAPLVLTQIHPDLKEELLGIDSPESTLFQYEPTAVLKGPSKEYVIRGFPPTKIGSTYYHILDFGLAPGISLTREGKVIIQSYVIQRLLPPGKIDSFSLGNLPYRIEMRIAPSRMMRKGTTEIPVFDLKDLHYDAEIYRGEKLIYNGLSDDGISFDGMELEFTPHIYWVRVEAAQRPGMIPLVLGLSLIIIGLPLWVGLKIVLLIKHRRIETE